MITSTIKFSGLASPKFDRYGRHTYNDPFAVPTSKHFYTCRTPLWCPHALGEVDVVPGSHWASTSNAMLCADDSGLLDPPQTIIESLPDGYHWSPNEGALNLFQARQHAHLPQTSIVLITHLVLSVLTKYLHNDPATCVSPFLTAHGIGVDDPVLDNPGVMFHLMNGYFWNYRGDQQTATLGARCPPSARST